MTNQCAIVTGVTGQMGSYFAEFLLAKGFKVVGTVRRISVKNHLNIEQIVSPNFTLAPMDLCDSHSINALVETYRPAYFINCAANSFVGSSWDYPEQHMDYNALGVMRQLEAIKRFSPSTRYINFGSSEEFGDVAYSPQDEEHPGRARSPYGASKIAARQIVKVYRESFGLYALQCWCLNYESERRGPEFVTRKITLGVARIARAIKDGKSFEPIELGNLSAQRDWSYALDFVDGIWRMVNQETGPRLQGTEDVIVPAKPDAAWEAKHGTKRANGNAQLWAASGALKEYVFASGETWSVRTFVDKAFAAAGIPTIWIDREGHPETSELHLDDEGGAKGCVVRINPAFYRPADVELLMGTAARAKEELGWTPKVSFDELVSRMVKSDLAAVGL